MRFFGNWLIPIASTVATLIIAAYILKGGGTWIGFWGLMTGIVWVWLSARANFWNFPVGLANAAIMSYGLYVDRIFADATLYAIYFVLLAIGWYQWKFGGRNRTERPISRVPTKEAVILAASAAILYGLAFLVLDRVGGYWPWIDGLGFALSLAAQYLLMRKYIENWWVWAVVNVLYTALYISKGFASFAIFSAILLVMSFVGHFDWRSKMLNASNDALALE